MVVLLLSRLSFSGIVVRQSFYDHTTYLPIADVPFFHLVALETVLSKHCSGVALACRGKVRSETKDIGRPLVASKGLYFPGHDIIMLRVVQK